MLTGTDEYRSLCGTASDNSTQHTDTLMGISPQLHKSQNESFTLQTPESVNNLLNIGDIYWHYLFSGV